MLSQLGIERPVLYVIAFAIILGLVALFGLVLRKLTGGRLMMNSQDRARARQPRLGVVDIYDLDRQRQLVLLRRDNVEHLLLIGGLNDVVIETNIVRVAGARIPAASVEQGADRFEPGFEPARPQVEAPARPSLETQLAAQLGTYVRRPPDESEEEPEPAAPPERAEPVIKVEGTRFGAASPVEGFRPVPPAAPFAEAPPVRVEPRPAYAQPVFQSRPTPQPVPARPEPARLDENAPSQRGAPDAAILSDMAKQLEEALKRPATPVAPEHERVELASAIEDNPDLEDDDLLEPPAPAEVEHDVGTPVILNDEIMLEEEEAAVPVEPVRSEDVEPEAPHREPAAVERSAQPPKSTEKAADPFSVEEIEAEFARLLGRPLDTGKKG